MPIYEYQCETCGACFEKLVFAGDDEPVTCPECGKRKNKKLVSCVSFMNSGIGATCSTGNTSGFS